MATTLRISPRAVDGDGRPHFLADEQLDRLVELLRRRPELEVTPCYPAVRVTSSLPADSVLSAVLTAVETVGGKFFASHEEEAS